MTEPVMQFVKPVLVLRLYKTLVGGLVLGLGVYDLDILWSYGFENVLVLQPKKS